MTAVVVGCPLQIFEIRGGPQVDVNDGSQDPAWSCDGFERPVLARKERWSTGRVAVGPYSAPVNVLLGAPNISRCLLLHVSLQPLNIMTRRAHHRDQRVHVTLVVTIVVL